MRTAISLMNHQTTSINNRSDSKMLKLAISLFMLFATQTANAIVILASENFEQVTGLTATNSRAVKDILTNNPEQLSAGLTIDEPSSSTSFISVRSADNGLNTNEFKSFNNFFSSNFLAMNIETGYDQTTNSAFGGTQLNIPITFTPAPSTANFIRFSFDYVLDGAIQAGSNQSFSAVLDDENPATPNPGPGLFFSTSSISSSFFPGGGVSGRFEAIYDLTASNFIPTRIFLSLTDGPALSAARWAGGFDNFLVEASETNNFSVPEPSTIALMGLGILGLRFSRQKAKQRFSHV